MEKINILDKIARNEISLEKANKLYEKLISGENASEIQKILMMNDIEWTAFAQGIGFEKLANYRIEKWPEVCYKCGLKINLKNFGWWFEETPEGLRIRHLECPTA